MALIQFQKLAHVKEEGLAKYNILKRCEALTKKRKKEKEKEEQDSLELIGPNIRTMILEHCQALA